LYLGLASGLSWLHGAVEQAIELRQGILVSQRTTRAIRGKAESYNPHNARQEIRMVSPD